MPPRLSVVRTEVEIAGQIHSLGYIYIFFSDGRGVGGMLRALGRRGELPCQGTHAVWEHQFWKFGKHLRTLWVLKTALEKRYLGRTCEVRRWVT